jgi:hypothetical protein
MGEKVHKCDIKREEGFLYYVDTNGDVGRVRRGSSKKEVVCPNNGSFTKEDGWIYYLDKSGDVSRSRMKSFREFATFRDDVVVGEEILLEKNWIQKSIKHPGRCTPAPNPDCPKGSPQYNLAMRFKHGDLHNQ